MEGDKALLLGIVAVLLGLTVFLVLPYVQFLLAAIVLAFVLRPLHDRIDDRIGKTPSALALVTFAVVAFLIPFVALVTFVASDVLGFVQELDDSDLEFEAIEETISQATGLEVDIASVAGSVGESVGQWAFGGAVTAFEFLTHFLIGIGLLLFLLFFFVRDGDRFVAWARHRTPLPPRVTDDLLERYRSITNAVLAGHVLVAVIQGLVAGVGLFVVGIPNVVFWTFVMILLALIPLIGTFAVWAPASVFLVLTGDVLGAVGLFVYGTVVVGLTDEYLRPVIVNRYAEVSPSVILVGVIGGLSLLGFMGIFVGPVIVGALKETIEVYDEHYGQDRQQPSG